MKQNRPLTETLIALGLDGIEAYCSYHDDATAVFTVRLPMNTN